MPKVAGMTWQKLADALGVSSRSVHNWRKLDFAPTEPIVEEWEAFVAENNLGSGGQHSSLEELKAERLRKQIELDQIKIDQQRKLVIPSAEVNEFLTMVATRSKAALYAALETELPPKLEGQDVAAIRSILREAADGICDRMQKGFDDWAEAHTPEDV